jgi:transaldolase
VDKLEMEFATGQVDEVLNQNRSIEARLQLKLDAEDEVETMNQTADIILNLEAEVTHEVEEKRSSISMDLLHDNVEKTLKNGRNYLRLQVKGQI